MAKECTHGFTEGIGLGDGARLRYPYSAGGLDNFLVHSGTYVANVTATWFLSFPFFIYTEECIQQAHMAARPLSYLT